MLYEAELAERGIAVTSAPWNGPFAPFQSAALVVLRSTWDYHYAPDAFVGWLRTLESDGTRICNAPQLLAWNMDKGYLLDLKRRDVPIPATAVVANDAASIAYAFDRLRLDQAVVKPAIGASGHHVRLVRRQEIASAVAELRGVTARLLVQEFVPEVRQMGELSCIFFDGRFSHAVVKQPTAGEYRV
ncbi:MAG: ATP-grasp domain-containing protein, partial [Dehalococcoidia bacterium]